MTDELHNKKSIRGHSRNILGTLDLKLPAHRCVRTLWELSIFRRRIMYRLSGLIVRLIIIVQLLSSFFYSERARAVSAVGVLDASPNNGSSAHSSESWVGEQRERVVSFLKCQLCESVSLQGQRINDCNCDFSSVNRAVTSFFGPLLSDITSRTFFRYAKHSTTT
jgi:hypothetical protein